MRIFANKRAKVASVAFKCVKCERTIDFLQVKQMWRC